MENIWRGTTRGNSGCGLSVIQGLQHVQDILEDLFWSGKRTWKIPTICRNLQFSGELTIQHLLLPGRLYQVWIRTKVWIIFIPGYDTCSRISEVMLAILFAPFYFGCRSLGCSRRGIIRLGMLSLHFSRISLLELGMQAPSHFSYGLYFHMPGSFQQAGTPDFSARGGRFCDSYLPLVHAVLEP